MVAMILEQRTTGRSAPTATKRKEKSLTNPGKVNRFGNHGLFADPAVYPDAFFKVREILMSENEGTKSGQSIAIELKDEIIEILNSLRRTTERLQKGIEVPEENVKTLLARGESLAQRIAALPGMAEAGAEFLEHLNKIGQAIKDLRNFDALKKENLVAGVKF
jgi:hypothetical protein